ncbi:ABC transporter ATP-binding protein [Aliikangiella maris]|uniref:Dipeptide ABC transporter ATP-binding protein n=2 Tax=Aliikangiella maris TaxID=3162458 RepID=A0ABV3MMP6_9GAMM
MSLLSARHLCKSYQIKSYQFAQKNQLDAIKDISFDLEKGKTLAIVGESGSGKSTLARQVIGIEKPTAGEVYFNNQVMQYNDKKMRRERFKNIRMIFQNPYESLNPQARIGKMLEEVLRINTRLTDKQRKEKVAETLSRVGLLSEHRHRYPHMFSGGQRQRIAIARAIILEPQVIIADEPLSALDVSIQAQILNLLQELQEEMGISYLFISHDLNVVEHVADDVMVMYRGEVVEQGTVAQIFDQPQHPYTQTLFASTPMYNKRFKNLTSPNTRQKNIVSESGCGFAQRCDFCDSYCKTHSPKLETKSDGYKIACFKVK